MDLFKLNNPTDPMKMEQGEILNDLTSKMWIERYRDAGEFELIASAHSGMREKLPIGSFISHVDTPEVMIVENHEITEDRDKEAEIKISGRGFETFFDHRIVGSNGSHPVVSPVVDLHIPSDYAWNQAITLLEEFLLAANLTDPDNGLSYLSIDTDVVDDGFGYIIERVAKRGSLYSAFLELLKVDDLGVRVIRPGPWSPLAPGSPNLAIFLHRGVNRANEVMFSYDTGEIESADYLWSIKKLKNAALIYGKWVEDVYVPPETGIERRWMIIDATDIDENVAEPGPTQQQVDQIVLQMEQRAIEVLGSQKEVALTKAEVSKDINKAGYREDFNVGDIITVTGSYSTTTTKRISEYVEIEDENGKQGYPTLTEIS